MGTKRPPVSAFAVAGGSPESARCRGTNLHRDPQVGAKRGWPKARRLHNDELKTIKQSIDAAKESLRGFRNRLSPEIPGDREVPEPEDE